MAEVAAEIAAQLADARGRQAAAADIEQVAQRVGLERADAETEYGNVLAILERGAEDLAERAIVAAFVAVGVVRILENDTPSARRWGERLCYLAAHAGFDPLSALPESVSPTLLRPLYRAIAEHARQIDLGKVATSDRAELLVAAAALADAVETMPEDDEIAHVVSRLGADLGDPVGVRLITARAAEAPATVVQSGPSPAALHGNLTAPPRSPVLTVIFALCGWLLLRSIGTLLGQYILGLKRDARLELTQSGLEIKGKVALLGKQLKDVSALYPTNGLAVVSRDVRYPALPIYAGLGALLVGTYAGVSFLSWGVQAASPRLLGYGVLALLFGVAIDFVITSLLPGVRGRCRLLVVPKKGHPICVGDLDIESADRLLADLSRRLA